MPGGHQIYATEPELRDEGAQKSLANDMMMKDCIAKQGVASKIPMSMEQMVIACNRDAKARREKDAKDRLAKSPSAT